MPELTAELARPYPGLRSFNHDEVEIFFGRDDCIHQLVDTLARTRFLAVLGSSGTGKSSIVKTGLLDALERGLMAEAGARWRVIDFRPGSMPLRNLARGLLQKDAGKTAPSETDVGILKGFLEIGPRSVIEWCRDGNLPPKTNLLLLVDQFEELFRYLGYAGKEESEAFAALLLASAHSPEFPIYVTLTMRSEYLGACSLIEGLAETISRGMVLTPRMTREQCREAIVGPGRVCDIRIEEPLVNQLLNDLANFAPWDDSGSADQLDRLVRRADQLPLLQYTLNRLWLDAKARGEDEQIQLRLFDYKAVGGLSGALDAHGNELLKDLSKKGRATTVEKVFRALIQGTTVADAVRRPQQLGDLVSLCDGDAGAVEDVLYAFCAPGCNFLAPELRDPGKERRKPLDRGQIIDISHESLIRQWSKMAEWLAKENSAVEHWRRLGERVVFGEPLRGRELSNLLAWRDEAQPTEAWANRNGGGFEAAIAFLEKSRRAESRRRKSVVVTTSATFLVLAGTTVAALLAFAGAHSAKKDIARMNAKLVATEETLKKQNKTLIDAQTMLEKQNKTLIVTQAMLKQKNDTLLQETADLQAANAKLALRAQADNGSVNQTAEVAAATLRPVVAVLGTDLGREPGLNRNYANETTDNNVKPTDQLVDKLDGPTPTSLPSALVLTTREVYDALRSGKIRTVSRGNVQFWLINVDAPGRSLPQAHYLADVGAGGKFDDATQKRLFEDLSKLVKSFGDGLIFFAADSTSWRSYNAALRTIQMGYPNVYWYRGGAAAWEAATRISP